MRALAELVSANEAIPETRFPIRAANLNYYMGQLLHEIATKGQSFDLAEVYMGRSLNALFSAEFVFDQVCHAKRWAEIQMAIAYVYVNHFRITGQDTSKSVLGEAFARVQAAADQFDGLGDEENANLCKPLFRDLEQER